MTDVGIGKLITTEQHRDAIHVAIAPVIAGEELEPGQKIAISKGTRTVAFTGNKHDVVGIVDPFLSKPVKPGEQFWMFLLPNTITSLRHNWSHPAFSEESVTEYDSSKSEIWMRKWAIEHMTEDYSADGGISTPQRAFEQAIEAGRENHVGPNEDARDHIDNDWWDHWENITGEKAGPRRDNYFSCSC